VVYLEKIDFKKQLKDLYNPSTKEVSVVDVPEMTFLMVDGQGDPNTSQEYRAAVEALFTVSYTLKFMVKKAQGIDYGVLPLEGLWWVDDMSKFASTPKTEWIWTAMIMQPKYVTAKTVEAAKEQAQKKKDLPALPKLRFETFHEGLSAQLMHIGPYQAEAANIAKIHAYIQNSGHTPTGKHHEIYLSDPQRTAPEKLKTIIRQPMK
jgi:hypothetical protein